jgi:Trypsin-co-occurring domain 1
VEKKPSYPILVDFGQATSIRKPIGKRGREIARPKQTAGKVSKRAIGKKAIPSSEMNDLWTASAEAIDQAMTAIQQISRRVGELDMPSEFSEVGVEFGFTLGMEGNALLAKAKAEAAISVALTWSRPEERSAKG